LSSCRVANTTGDALKGTLRDLWVIVAALLSIGAAESVISADSERACAALWSIVSGLPSIAGESRSTSRRLPVIDARMRVPNNELRSSRRLLRSIGFALRSIVSAIRVIVAAKRSSVWPLPSIGGPMWAIGAALRERVPGLQLRVGAKRSIETAAQVISAVLRSMIGGSGSLLVVPRRLSARRVSPGADTRWHVIAGSSEGPEGIPQRRSAPPR